MIAPPLQRRLVEVNADGAVLVVARDELAGGVRRAAEVLSQQTERSAANLFESLRDEVDLGLDALDRRLVADMAVGDLGERLARAVASRALLAGELCGFDFGSGEHGCG